MKNVKIKDFRQGVTLYYVMAFPLESKGGDAKVETYNIKSRAYLKKQRKGGSDVISKFLAKTLWFKESHLSSWRAKPYVSEHSVTDSGVACGKTNYNFHRMFHTRKQAQRYADRMNAGRLTHEEREHAIEMIDRDARINSFFDGGDRWSDYGY